MNSLRPRAWVTLGSSLLASMLLFSTASVVRAADIAAGDDTACLECHADAAFASPAHPETKCAECHTNITQTPHDALPAEQKLAGDAICAQCHGMATKQLAKSVHAEHTCKKCHGPGHSVDVATNGGAKMSALGPLADEELAEAERP